MFTMDSALSSYLDGICGDEINYSYHEFTPLISKHLQVAVLNQVRYPNHIHEKFSLWNIVTYFKLIIGV